MASGTILTYGPANIDSLLATSRSVILKLSDFLADNVFTGVPLLNYLNQKAKVEKSGGASILVPIMSGKNGTAKSYTGLQILDTTPQEGMTMAQFTWRKYAASVAIAEDEVLANAGDGKLNDIVKGKVMQATLSVKDKIDIDLFAAAQVSTAVQSLPLLVDATSTIADINSTTNSFWQASVTASGSFAGQGLSDLRAAWNTVMIRGQSGGVPDFLVTTQAVLQFYEATLEPGRRYEGNEKLGHAGFENFKFKSATITFDPNVATGELYMLSSQHLKYVVHSQRNMKLGEWVKPSNQDGRVAQMFWMGNLVTDNRRKLAKLTGVTA